MLTRDGAISRKPRGLFSSRSTFYSTTCHQLKSDSAFNQQRTRSLRVTLSPLCIVFVLGVSSFICYFFTYCTFQPDIQVFGLVFCTAGALIYKVSSSMYLRRVQYDGDGTRASEYDCQISRPMQGARCNVTMTIPANNGGTLLVFYELTDFYQGLVTYQRSSARYQNMGDPSLISSSLSDCYPLLNDGIGNVLNPCGLVSNSLFNDLIELISPSELRMTTSSIALEATKRKFSQPRGFASTKALGSGNYSVLSCFQSSNSACPNSVCAHWLGDGHEGCKGWLDVKAEKYWVFYYPLDNYTTYLYENFPEVVSPLEGQFITYFKSS